MKPPSRALDPTPSCLIQDVAPAFFLLSHLPSLWDFPANTQTLCAISYLQTNISWTYMPREYGPISLHPLWPNASKELFLLNTSTSFSQFFSWTHHSEVSFSFTVQKPKVCCVEASNNWDEGVSYFVLFSPGLCLLSWHILIDKSFFLQSEMFWFGQNYMVVLPTDSLHVPTQCSIPIFTPQTSWSHLLFWKYCIPQPQCTFFFSQLSGGCFSASSGSLILCSLHFQSFDDLIQFHGFKFWWW